MKDNLMDKNVAADIADELIRGVSASLVGRKLEMLGRVSTAVRTATEATLQRILSPNRNVDILSDIERRKRESNGNAPYVIVFIGVNGVGKSTSLAKVTHFLKQAGNSIKIAACDTFRAGAVEQLRVHARR